jgi:hypothetical protein
MMASISKNLMLQILVENVTENNVVNSIAPFLINDSLLCGVYLDIFDCEYATQYELDYLGKYPNLIEPYWYHEYDIYNISTIIHVKVSYEMQKVWGLSIIPIIETIIKKVSMELEAKIVMEFRDWNNKENEFIPFKIYHNGAKIADHYDKYSYLFKDAE